MADSISGGHEVGVGEDAVVFDVVDAECCVRVEEGVASRWHVRHVWRMLVIGLTRGESSVLMMC